MSEDPFAGAAEMKKGAVVTCTVTAIQEAGLDVEVSEGVTGFIRKGDLSRDRGEQRSDRFAVGDKLDAKITSIDNKTRKVSLSIKSKEVAEEKEAVAQYGSSDAGASLGDILGAAMRKAEGSDD